nr:hypothetical protein [Campylobacter sp.]
MKILLLGEFSGFFNNLKEGLLELGHEAVTASSGDGWKNNKRDIDLQGRLWHIFKIKNLINYDVVQLINPFVLYRDKPIIRNFNNMVTKYLVGHNKKFFLSACGDDSFFWLIARKKLQNMPFEDSLNYDFNKKHYYMENDEAFKFNKLVADISDGIIPVSYDYYIGYEGHKNLKLNKFIPLPINTNKIIYKDNVISNNKLVIFHGLNRRGFKGTKYFEKAFEILQKKYPNDLELVIDGYMPFDKYLEVIGRVNIIADQAFCYGVGMNALYSMAQGKVVLAGGYKREALDMLGIDKSPTVTIMPDENNIVAAVEYLLENRNKIQDMGYQSRQFVEKYHNHIKIAEKYLDVWSSN